MKKFLALLLLAVFFIAACNGGGGATEPPENDSTDSIMPVPPADTLKTDSVIMHTPDGDTLIPFKAS